MLDWQATPNDYIRELIPWQLEKGQITSFSSERPVALADDGRVNGRP